MSDKHTRKVSEYKLTYESHRYTWDEERYMVLKSGRCIHESSDMKEVLLFIAQCQREETPTIFGQISSYTIVTFKAQEYILGRIKSDKPIKLPGRRPEAQPKW